MVFSSFIFLYLFLPLTVFAYFASPRRIRNYVLLVSSLIFYAWGAPQILIFLLLSCGADYWASLYLAPLSHSEQKRTRVLWGIVTFNLGLLAYYKYANFYVEQSNFLFTSVGISPIVWTAVILPIGISFFTFQKISYLVDVYRGEVAVADSVFDYALYVLLFPQLIAGPIVRYEDVQAEIRSRSETLPMAFEGMVRFCIGLGKKALLADPLGAVADNVFSTPMNKLPAEYAWLGIFCYSFQIFYDFSGYSDMAIGLGKIFGFNFLENFNHPYISTSFTEFWRRWHISLSSWMREYLYIPLGGNRGSTARTYANLWLVFLFSGLWHGASWNFVAWGGYHGAFLAFDKLCWLNISKRLPTAINTLITFFFVMIGWVLFRAENLSQAGDFLAVMFGLLPDSQPSLIPRGEIIHNRAIFALIAGAALAFAPALSIREDNTPSFSASPFTWGAFALVLLLLSTTSLAALGFTPFLYFRF